MKGFSEDMLSLYLVTDRAMASGRPLERTVEEAVRGGVTMVQLREKNCPQEEFVALAVRLKSLLKGYGVPLIINDDVEVARLSGADGVHLGQSDMSPARARRILGPDRIIGLSVENFDQVQQAECEDVDYIAASPVYKTDTKTDTKVEFGVGGVRKMVRMSSRPVVGIGRMNCSTAGDVIAAGAAGVAVVSAVMAAENPREAASALRESVESARAERELASSGMTGWSRLISIPMKMSLRAVERHPFVGDMLKGRLRYHRFRYWLVQNYLMWSEFVTALKYLEVRLEGTDAPYGPAALEIVRSLLGQTVPLESEVYDFYFVGVPDLSPSDESEPTSAMKQHLRNAVREGELPQAISAMTAYLLMYRSFGGFVKAGFSPESNRYVTWLNIYSGEEFRHDVESAVRVTDSVAGMVGRRRKVRMVTAFSGVARRMAEVWTDAFADRDKPSGAARDKISEREDRRSMRG